MRKTFHEEKTVQLSLAEPLAGQVAGLTLEALAEFMKEVEVKDPADLTVHIDFETIQVRALIAPAPIGVALAGIVTIDYEEGDDD